MAGVNKVILVGNLGKDPEIRHLEGGTAVAKFSLATSEHYKDKAGIRQEQTEWHNIVVWKERADFAEKYLKKGMTVYLEGKIRSRSWDDKEGAKHYITEIVAENITIIKNSAQNSNPNNAEEGSADISASNTEGLPF